MRNKIILIGFCAFLSACSAQNLPYEKSGDCTEGTCEVSRVDVSDRHWLYQWYYFLAFPFIRGT